MANCFELRLLRGTESRQDKMLITLLGLFKKVERSDLGTSEGATGGAARD